MLAGETSATPRGLSLLFQSGNPITEYRMRRVRQIHDWDPQEFHLNINLEGNEIVCQGVDPLALPAGGYELRVSISDLQEQEQPVDVDVPDNGAANVTLKFVDDPRRFVLTTPVEEFDPEIKRVVEDPGTVLDGLTATAWLDSAGPRPRRKACLMNLLAKLRAAKGPQPKTPLITDVSSIFFADVDRVYARVNASFLANLQALAADDSKPFYLEGAPKASVHADLLQSIAAWEPDAQLFHLLSFRQEGKPSMQAVVAVPPGGDTTRTYYSDLDIDLGNPLQDVEGVLIHFGELLDPGKTDHLKLAATLAKGATADFTYYKVVKTRTAAG
ncbi:MAG TPA: hypothetical protein VF532_22480 [Candidatus Angelobacter sp.]